MAHEIMSVKLCELDDRVARLHSRLRLTETADAEHWTGRLRSRSGSARKRL